MTLEAAAFSDHASALLTASAITFAFPTIKRRPVNVLREEEFPLLAAWVEGDEEANNSGSDDDTLCQTQYTCLVAAKLGASEQQDVVLGQLLKVIRDCIETIARADVDYRMGRWDSDNNAAEGDGDKVWASFVLEIEHHRPRGDY